MTGVSIIEDDKNFRAGLEKLIGNSKDFSVINSYASAEEALAHLFEHPPEIAIVDIKLPGENGIELIAKLKARLPELHCIVCTYYDDDDFVFHALKNGASGYIIKDAHPENMLESLRELRDGGAPMSRYIARKVIATFHEKSSHLSLPGLSERENEVLRQVAEGLMVKEISSQLNLSVHTIKSHLKHIYHKLHVNNRVEAVNKLNERKT